MNIFVGSLPFQLEEADLRELFEAYGEVSTVKLISDRETGRSKGFGFVEMPDDENAQKAITGLNGAEVKGRSIAVSQAEEKKPNIMFELEQDVESMVGIVYNARSKIKRLLEEFGW